MTTSWRTATARKPAVGLLATLLLYFGVVNANSESTRTIVGECSEAVTVRSSAVGSDAGEGGVFTSAVRRALASAVASIHGAFVSQTSTMSMFDERIVGVDGRTSMAGETRLEQRIRQSIAGVIESFVTVSTTPRPEGLTEVVLDVRVCTDERLAIVDPVLHPAWTQSIRGALLTRLSELGVVTVPASETLAAGGAEELFFATGATRALRWYLNVSERGETASAHSVALEINYEIASLRDGGVTAFDPVRVNAQGLTRDLARATATRLALDAFANDLAPKLVRESTAKNIRLSVSEWRRDATYRLLEELVRDLPGVLHVQSESSNEAGTASWLLSVITGDACSVASTLISQRRFLGFVDECDATHASIIVTRD